MADEEITIEKLAEMIKNGFDKTATKDQFDNLEKRMITVEGKLTSMDEKLDKVDSIEKEVEYIKNTFSIPAIKNN